MSVSGALSGDYSRISSGDYLVISVPVLRRLTQMFPPLLGVRPLAHLRVGYVAGQCGPPVCLLAQSEESSDA